ncbi:MAG: ComF family protein [Demequinaceae bacterium]|nr:ComF family protein [Demequinaceae bacterium]
MDVVEGLRALARTVVPIACPGCGLEDLRWCEECAASWWEAPFRSESGAPRLDIEGRATLPVWSVAPLLGSSHLMVSAWKDGGRRDLDPFFSDAIRRAARELAPALSAGDVIVPVPPHRRSVRSRGLDLTAMLALAAAEGFAAAGRSIPVERLLVNRGYESRALGDRERWLNAGRGIRAREGSSRAMAAVLVDDVVTTGASLARASEVLEARGITVVGALTLAATPSTGTSVLQVRHT